MSPKLRKLIPDEALFRRRAGEEPLRDLARDYDVQHTTLSRYFARPEAAKELKRVKRLIQAEQREAEAARRAEERAERTAQRQVKQQPPQANRTTGPPAAAAGEVEPAQPDAGRPIRRPNSVAVPSAVEPAPTRDGYPGYLDRIDAERAARVGRAPGQPANSFLDPDEWLDHQAKLAELNGDEERLEKIARARAEFERPRAEWDAR